MPVIFISYRRSDTRHAAARIAERLEAHFGGNSVFRDIEQISPGAIFDDSIKDALRDAVVVLALIGDRWHGDGGPGDSRFHDESDLLRQEIAFALEHEKLMPVLVDASRMPTVGELPTPLQKLTRVQATFLRDHDFDTDVKRIIAKVDALRTARKLRDKDQTDPFLVPGPGEPVTAEHLVLRHTCFRTPKRDAEFGERVYSFGVRPDGAPEVLGRIEYVYYFLPPAWPPSESPKLIETPGFVLKNLTWDEVVVRARVYIAGQNDPVPLSAYVRRTETGPRIDS
jgi:hypothetical protein